MKIKGLGDTYEDFIQVDVELEESDIRNEFGREMDGEDFNSTCYMVEANYTNEISNVVRMMLNYIPMEGGLHEVVAIEKDSNDWNLIKGYIKSNKVE